MSTVSFVPATTPAVTVPAFEPVRPGESGILRLDLVGEIGPDRPISHKAIQRRLQTTPQFSRIAISINSGGGSVDEALKIYEFLRALPLPISARAESECCSAAMTVFLAAAHRIAVPKTSFLLHGTRRGFSDSERKYTAQDLRREADDLSAIDDRLIDLLAARTGSKREWFADQFLNEDDLSEIDLLNSGLVHEIEGRRSPCGPSWPEQAKVIMDAGLPILARMRSANYFAACLAVPAPSDEPVQHTI